MSDDYSQRSYRSTEPPARNAPGANPNSASDPLAELARLIGQNNSFANSGRDSARRAVPPPMFDVPPAAPSYGANDYHAASTAPADVPPYDPPGARRVYANPSHAAGADPYHAENEVPGYPGASTDGYQADRYQPNQFHPAGAHEEIYDDAPPRRRIGILAIAIVFALVVIGTAGAFGYRALYGSSGTKLPPPVIKADTAPSKIVPASASATPSKLITDRVADLSKDEKLVSREEKPVEIKSAPAPQPQGSAPAAANPAPSGIGVLTSEPKKIHTIAIRPDQESQPMAASAPPAPPLAPPAASAAPSPVKPAAPPPQAASNAPVANTPEPAPRPAERRAVAPERQVASAVRDNAPLSLSPDANAAAPAPRARAPMRTAAAAAPAPIARAAAPVGGSGSYVQISSQRSEAEAQASFRGLQSKYPSQLGNRRPVIRKVELGAKGTYYRAMVGPLAGTEASTLCSGLKAAGASCLIQRN
jgi:hypothetical protein